MRVAIETLGTRGDVQPYVALARGLMARGHDVQLAGPAMFAGFAERWGVPYAPLPGEFQALLDGAEARRAVAEGQGFSVGLKLLKYLRPMMAPVLVAEWEAVRAFAPDVVVYHPNAIAGPHMAERLGVPSILAPPIPGFTATMEFPSPVMRVGGIGVLNWLTHQMPMRSGEVLFDGVLRRWRAETLGLARRRPARPAGTIYSYSPSVLPRPRDWDESVQVAGYWFLDEGEGWQAPEGLQRFLDGGDAPVYVGFGSMPGVDPRGLAAAVTEGLARAGWRGVLATGGGALEVADAPQHIHVIEGAPHDWLFPRMHAVLHHGGAGTTGASLRAGVPTIVCPFLTDQPFWGRRVAQLGVGPAPLDRRRLDAASLAAAFSGVDEPGVRQRAAELGRRIAAEDGVGVAVEFIERHAVARRPVGGR